MLKIWLLVCLLAYFENCGADDAHCPNTQCTPAPAGAQCSSKYDRDNGCCPVWTCSDGHGGTYTVYGMSSSSSSSSSSGSSFQSSSGGGGGGFAMPPMNFPGFGGGGFPGFGGMFGR